MSTTETNNKTLAEFIGYKVATTQKEYDNYIENGFSNITWHIGDLQFNSFLDALLPVWEKIEQLGFYVSIRTSKYSHGNTITTIQDAMGGTVAGNLMQIEITEQGLILSKIESIYRVFVEFIKWYNQQNK